MILTYLWSETVSDIGRICPNEKLPKIVLASGFLLKVAFFPPTFSFHEQPFCQSDFDQLYSVEN